MSDGWRSAFFCMLRLLNVTAYTQLYYFNFVFVRPLPRRMPGACEKDAKLGQTGDASLVAGVSLPVARAGTGPGESAYHTYFQHDLVHT